MHTLQYSSPNIEVLPSLSVVHHVDQISHPYQASCVISINIHVAHPGVSICHAGAIASAFLGALIEASARDTEELVRDLHARKGQETVSMGAPWHLLGAASL